MKISTSFLMGIAISVVFQLVSCNMKTYTLLNNITTVPKDSKVYVNRFKFAVSLLKVVDTSVVYEEYNSVKNVLMRLDPCTTCRVYGVYKFYSNGFFNAFYLDKERSYSAIEFNPLYAGNRGVYYTQNNIIRFDLFAEIDERQNLGKVSGTLTFNGDTMYLKRDDVKGLNATLYEKRVFLKAKLPSEYPIYQVNWQN